MDKNAFLQWLGQRDKLAIHAITHPSQLRGSTAQSTLRPVQNRTRQELTGKFYLPHPNAYLGPISHNRVDYHQTPHKQDPLTQNPNVSSRYLLPVQNPLQGR